MSALDAVDGSSTGTRVPRMWELLRLPRLGGASHANGYDNRSRYRQTSLSMIRRQLKRRQVLAFFQRLPACLVGIEACASSHHWGRELQVLGHTVRLMPPSHLPTRLPGWLGPTYPQQTVGPSCRRRYGPPPMTYDKADPLADFATGPALLALRRRRSGRHPTMARTAR
jgi:hypothetical protein